MSGGWSAAPLVVAAYLLGSVSFSYLIVRVLRGIDVRSVGSGNAGATNVMRAAGRGPALLALALDVGKGVTAVVAARRLGASPEVVALAGVAVVVGHVYPLYFGFRGGKGVATAGGALFALAWLPTLGALLVFVLAMAWKRVVSLGSILAACSLPLFLLLGRIPGIREPDGVLSITGTPGEGGFWPLFAATVAIAALVVFRHSENLARLRAGTEPRLGGRA